MKCGSTAMPKPAMVALSCAIRLALRKFRRDLWRDLRQVVELRREQKLLDVADEAVPRQVGACGDDRRLGEIGGCGIKPECVVQELAADDAAFLRHGQADRDVGLALGEREQPRGGDELQIEIGIPFGELDQPRGQKVAAEAVGRADPHRAGEMGARAADRLLVGDDGGFHRLRAVGDALAGLGQQIAGLAAIKQFCGKVALQPVDTADHCGMIDAELLGGSRNRPAAHDGKHETEVVPVDCAAALIQHFRTSMVQFIGLESHKMQGQ
ncbi:hypothetical protein ABIF29_003014 [Bradyrhizobium elkanii]|uniref:Uncharacterized protein n=1 Tax=Bradyrhizobium elkanii TaxID=29448 RepID=A0ABV4EZJ8_BRAEL